MRVLLIEDDAALARSVEMALKNEGLSVYVTDLGEEGIDLAKLYDYDIVLLDDNLPDISGFDVLRALRSAKIDTPVMMLSGILGVDDKVRGLGCGADDWLTKPFHKGELLARINAIVRRSKGHARSALVTGDLVVDLNQRIARIGEVIVHLTNKEYNLLECLMLRTGKLCTKETLFNHLYGGMDEPELKTLDVFICKLRGKLSKASDGRNYIETVWGRGYRLVEPPFCPPPATTYSGHASKRLLVETP
jgi:two-component system cell cycle response regulator CtrA